MQSRMKSHLRGGALPDFHLVSFEGPDPYARAGGIASRVTGLAQALADAGARSHLWFVGDPALPGREVRERVQLRRWCQWISAHHPGGVYDGEDGKVRDLEASLPPWLVEREILPRLREPGRRVVVLAEEWQTAGAVVHLDRLLREQKVRDRVALLWNVNNTYGLERVDWPALVRAARVTTVSRFMRERLRNWGVEALVLSNGLSPEAYEPPSPELLRRFRERTVGRTVLAKVGRWVPEKHWLLAVETTAALRSQGWSPLLVARGGVEPHGAEVMERAAALGLRVAVRPAGDGGVEALLGAIGGAGFEDLLVVDGLLEPEACRLLYAGSAAVLANSAMEPFGLVGLEAMAVGGVACVGSTGEDYAVPGWNALALQTQEPAEFEAVFGPLRDDIGADEELRERARRGAAWFSWDAVVSRQIIPQLHALFPGAPQTRVDPVNPLRRTRRSPSGASERLRAPAGR